MESISISAPAKINTILRVVGRRPNGYHDLVMVMEKLTLADDIILERIDHGIELINEGAVDEGMVAQKNLAWRAATAFRDATGEKRGVRIHLTKRIPVAAGLGGGSSDAAATLRGLNQLWEKGWSGDQLAQLGAELGADVPFFCFDGPALVQGIGDRVTPLEKKLPKFFVLLINPGFPVSTPSIYRCWDEINARLTVDGVDVRVPRLFETFRDVTANLVNDLESVTVNAHPEVGEVREFLSLAGAQGVLMAGSGPTVFGLFAEKSQRDQAADKVIRNSWRVIATEN